MNVIIRIDYVGVKSIIDNLKSQELTKCLLSICWCSSNSDELKNYWTSITPNYKQYELIRKWILDYNKQYYEMYYFVEDWLQSHKSDNWELIGGDWEDMSYYEVRIDDGSNKKIVTNIEGFDKYLKNIVTTETIHTIEIKTDENYQGLINSLKKLERLD